MESHIPALIRKNAVTVTNKRRKIEPKGDFITPSLNHLTFSSNKVVDVGSWKIGYDRYLYVIQRQNGGVFICLKDILLSPGGSISPKNIELTVNQFKVLYGVFLSGKARGARFQPKDGTDCLFPNYNLGEGVRFVWSRFAKADVAIVRRFIEKGNGDLVSVASGFSFTDKYNSLLTILQSLVSSFINFCSNQLSSLLILILPTFFFSLFILCIESLIFIILF